MRRDLPVVATASSSTDETLQRVVSAEELVQFQATAQAQRLARLEADAELMLRLSVEGFEGAAWREVAQALVEYGYAVMGVWVRTGQVFAKLAERGRRVPEPPTAGIPLDDATTLAEDSVADAIVSFRDNVLKKAVWNPGKGASLTTFFIGNCLLFQFPNLYRRWHNDYRKSRRLLSIQAEDGDERTLPLLSSRSDVSVAVVEADAARRKIAELVASINDPTNRTILLMEADDYSLDEIAEVLQMDYGAVESRLYRVRKKLGIARKT